MCYAIPGKVVEIRSHKAILDYFGERKTVFTDHNVKKGNYVYAQGGIVVNKISKKEADSILCFWKRKFFELKKRDEILGKVKKRNSKLNKIFLKVKQKKSLVKKEIKTLLNAKKDDAVFLHSYANFLRKKNLKNSCCVHGIIEFSNYCRMNCFYCGIKNSAKIKRYRMSEQEIISAAENAVKLGFKALVLQSGEDLFYTKKMLSRIIKKIKNMGVLVCLSIGERDFDTYKTLYKKGAKAVLLRFETSNKKIYEKMKPKKKLKDRISLIKKLQSIGYLVSTGFLIGLPKENINDLIDNILLTKKLKPDMYSFGPFIRPKSKQNIELNLLLNTISTVRIIDKKSKILVTTALETISSKGKKLGLLAGANSLMIDVTPKKYAKLYRLYKGKFKEMKEEIKNTLFLLYSLGRAPTDLGL